MDNLYCEPSNCDNIMAHRSTDPSDDTVTHYAEASLMPMLVNKLIFRIIPSRAPFFLRPLLNGVFSTVSSKLLDPRLKTHAKLVRA